MTYNIKHTMLTQQTPHSKITSYSIQHNYRVIKIRMITEYLQ